MPPETKPSLCPTLPTGNQLPSRPTTVQHASTRTRPSVVFEAPIHNTRLPFLTPNTKPILWWQVDLEDNYLVDTIRVYNRFEGLFDRLSGFTVTLYNEHKNETRVLQGPTDTTDMGGYIDLNLLDAANTQNLLQNGLWCFPTRYVKIELDNNYLSLREVQVFALDRTTSVNEDEGQPLVELHYGDEVQLFLQGNHRKVLGPDQ